MTPSEPPPGDVPFRWQAIFQKAADPLFLLNKHRRLLFVNRAWETLTGLKLSEVKGQPCRRRPRGVLAEAVEVILGALTPPPEALAGQAAQVRRLLHGLPADTRSWRVTFVPLGSGDALAGILGRIEVLSRHEQVARPPLPEKVLQMREQAAALFRLDQWIGSGPAMQRLRTQISLAAQTSLPVLIIGPAGAGKHWVARAIHEQGPGRLQAFACIECGHLPVNVVADLLFTSNMKNRAKVATIYLKDANRLVREHQAQLAEWLGSEEGIARLPRVLFGVPNQGADKAPAPALVEDLHCVASTLVLDVPALRDRANDLPDWIETLLVRAAAAADKPVPKVGADAMNCLAAHAWPGNLAELYRVLVGASLRAKSDQIGMSDLPFYIHGHTLPTSRKIPLDSILEEAEKRLVSLALRLANNNKTRAADILSIWRPRLLRRMEALDIADKETETP